MIAGSRHLASVITWKPLVATTIATTTWLALTARPSGPLLSVAAAAVAAVTAHVLDDPASVTFESSPTTLLRRRTHRVALALPLVGVWWALAITAVSRSNGHLPLAAHTLQLIALLAVGLAGASVAANVIGDRARGGTAGAVAVVVCFGTAFLPERALQLLPSDPAAPGAARRLLVILALALVIQAGSSIDPAERLLGRQSRRTRPAAPAS